MSKTTKREDYISWEEYFIGLAQFAAQRSKDPNRQVGACIVNAKHQILSVGYNGLPNGISDDDIPWDKTGEFAETKYPYVIHAEINAILNASGREFDGATIFVTLFPCNECAKLLVQAGVKKVVFADDHNFAKKEIISARRIFALAGVETEKYRPSGREIVFIL